MKLFLVISRCPTNNDKEIAPSFIIAETHKEAISKIYRKDGIIPVLLLDGVPIPPHTLWFALLLEHSTNWDMEHQTKLLHRIFQQLAKHVEFPKTPIDELRHLYTHP